MSHDSKDDAIRKILKSGRNADDSKESKKDIKPIPKDEDDKNYEWETNKEDSDDSEW